MTETLTCIQTHPSFPHHTSTCRKHLAETPGGGGGEGGEGGGGLWAGEW